jgi:L-rhamnose isomerase
MKTKTIEQSYARAKDQYAEIGVDTEAVLKRLAAVPLSLHCWQGDDVGGFETSDAALSGGGIQVTGNYPGKARTPDQLRSDLDQAYALIPGTHRLNLHALYAETGGKRVERNALQPAHFANWIGWAKERGYGLDFNPSCFSHPKANDGFTLASLDAGIRKFWIEHCIACRKIGEAMGRALKTPCVTNVWIPDGCKDMTVSRKRHRDLLRQSLDTIFKEPTNPRFNRDAVESKLFGIGSESYVVGSHEFYLGYAIRNGKLLTIDMGHFHPTENVADKLSSVFQWVDELLLHISRGVRWDSDHVVILNDDLRAMAEELVRGDYLGRTHLGLDYFDGSINRVMAWVIGARNLYRALLLAMLEPIATLRNCEAEGDFSRRLALLEELKSMPFSAVWDQFCLQGGVPVGAAWIDEVKAYERTVQSGR